MAPVLRHKRYLAPVWRYYRQRLLVVSVYNGPGVEVRVDGLLEFGVIKGEKVAHVCCVVERHLAAVVIQVDAHPLGGFAGVYQVLLRVGAGFVLAAAVAPVPQHQRPEAVLWAQADLLLPVHGGQDHAEAPRRLGADLHLPVMSAGGEGLRAQDDVVAGEAFRVVGQVGLEFSHLDTGAAWGHPEAGVGRVGVEAYGCDGWKGKNKIYGCIKNNA